MHSGTLAAIVQSCTSQIMCNPANQINRSSQTASEANRIRAWSKRMSPGQQTRHPSSADNKGGATGDLGDEDDEITEEDFEESKLLISNVPIGGASEDDIMKYVYCGPEVMPPEAYNEWHQDPKALQEGMRPVKGGCQGMQVCVCLGCVGNHVL